MVDEETFFAWLDGELSPEQSARVEAEVAADRRLSRLVEEHREMTAGLRSAFGEVASAPVPERIAAIVPPPEDRVVDLARVRCVREARGTTRFWVQLAALAATLVVGVLTGSMLAGGPTSPIRPEAGRLVAGAELEQVLSAQLASAPAAKGPRIGLTFRDKSGAICRTFQEETATGLACRERGDWRIRALFQAHEGQATDYRMAAGADPRLMEIVEFGMDGEPFDAAQEKSARDSAWK